jgi:hypothetical protein
MLVKHFRRTARRNATLGLDKFPAGPLPVSTTHRLSIPQVLAVCPIQTALLALHNNSTKVVSETKTGSITSIVFNQEVLTTLRGLFPSTKRYRFQIHANNTYSSSSGGVVQIANAASPTVSTYSEWAALSALFDECKLVSSRMGITSSGLLTKPIPLWCAFDHVTSTGSGVGFGNVQRLAGSRAVQSNSMDRGSARHVQSVRIASSRLYATTAIPTSTSADIGMNGQWDISGQDSTVISTVVFYFDVENVVSFRNRA